MPASPGRDDVPTLQENIPLPEARAVLAIPEKTGDSQSGVPSSRITQV
jgi:hypothetical protein